MPWFFDYDNDGWLDLFVTAYDAELGDIAADYMGRSLGPPPPSSTRTARSIPGCGHPFETERPLLPMGTTSAIWTMTVGWTCTSHGKPDFEAGHPT